MSGITEKRTQILCILFELNYFQGGKFSDNMINSGCIRALIEGEKIILKLSKNNQKKINKKY